ncbi:MAG: acyltransferase [Clostridia bacterium]|nr:acyltransferase [Clostridia bacterium]
MNTYERKNRESSYELLRLCCIFGIIVMHIYGTVYTTAKGTDLVFGVLINTLFNSCVTIFILISGYFGIRLRIAKLIKLDYMVVFYSLIGLIIFACFGEQMGFMKILSAVFPVLFNKYWFITCYFILCLLSPWINQIPEKLEQKQFRRLLITSVIIFCVIPMLTLHDIVMDSGKGMIHMTIAYLIGRYLAVYGASSYKKRKIFLCFMLFVSVALFLNTMLTLARGGNGVSAPFTRDCTLLTLGIAVTVFLFFREIHIRSTLLNTLTGSVLAIYVMEEAVRYVLGLSFHIEDYLGTNVLPLVCMGYALVVMVVCILIDQFRSAIFGKIEERLAEKEEQIVNGLVKNLSDRFIKNS